MTIRPFAVKLRPSYRTRPKYFSSVSTPHPVVVSTVEQADSWKAATEYVSNNKHAYLSSSEVSACSVEPGSAHDVGQIVHRSNTALDK